MPVNANKSGARLLDVVEQVARSQPVSVRALARELDIDKSAVQRAMTTLVEAGWARPARSTAGAFELTGRLLHVAHLAHGGNELRERAKPALESLRERTGETAYLAMADAGGLVVVEAAESRQALRLVMPIGTILDFADSAAGRAVLPHLDPAGREEILAGRPGPAIYDAESSTGDYQIAGDGGADEALNIAAPLFDVAGKPCGALAIYAVRARHSADGIARIGEMLAAQARDVSGLGKAEYRLGDPRRAIGSFG